jgi:thiosulfate dehydrogenase (quinone) large subunit
MHGSSPRLNAPGLFSVLISYGEFLVGAGILLGLLTGVAACFVVLMDHMLSGTVSINPMLGMFGLFKCFPWPVCGCIGLARWLLPTLGMLWKPGVLFQRPHGLAGAGDR